MFSTDSRYRRSQGWVIIISVWSRSSIGNFGLTEGSVFPFIEYAEKNNYSCIVLNPNLGIHVSGFSDSMEGHSLYVWENILMNPKFCSADYFLIVAHSAGGYCVTSIFKNFSKVFLEKVISIAFTDSFFAFPQSPEINKFVKEVN